MSVKTMMLSTPRAPSKHRQKCKVYTPVFLKYGPGSITSGCTGTPLEGHTLAAESSFDDVTFAVGDSGTVFPPFVLRGCEWEGCDSDSSEGREWEGCEEGGRVAGAKPTGVMRDSRGSYVYVCGGGG